MNKILTNALMFATGAAVGSLVTWKIVKNKYERLIQDEVDAFKEDYNRCMRGYSETDAQNKDTQGEDEEDEEDEDPVMTMYRDLARMYDQPGDKAENDGEGAGDEEVPYINGPCVITPEDFADGDYDHELHSLTYYSDGVLADDWLVQLDIDETIGEDSLEHFGDYVDDIVHVRNERLKSDYEVARDPRTYAEMIENAPLMHTYANSGSN